MLGCTTKSFAAVVRMDNLFIQYYKTIFFIQVFFVLKTAGITTALSPFFLTSIQLFNFFLNLNRSCYHPSSANLYINNIQ